MEVKDGAKKGPREGFEVEADRVTYDGTGALIMLKTDEIELMIAPGNWSAVRRMRG